MIDKCKKNDLMNEINSGVINIENMVAHLSWIRLRKAGLQASNATCYLFLCNNEYYDDYNSLI